MQPITPINISHTFSTWAPSLSSQNPPKHHHPDIERIESPFWTLDKTWLVFILLFFTVTISANAQTVLLEPFTGVRAGGILTVELIPGDTFLLVVDAPDDVAREVKARVEDNVLNLVYHGPGRDLGRVSVRVTAPEFRNIIGSGLAVFSNIGVLETPELSINGSGAANFRLQLQTSLLTTRLSGASLAYLSGFAHNHKINLSGAAQLKAGYLDTDSTRVNLSGASNAVVNARNALVGRLSGSTNLETVNVPLTQDVEASGLSTFEVRQAEGDTARRVSPDVTIRLGDREFRMTEEQPEPEKPRRKRFRNNWAGIELGINGYLTPQHSFTLLPGYEYLDLKYERSIAVNVNLIQKSVALIDNRVGMFTGLGIGWNNYRIGNDFLLAKGVNQIASAPVTEANLRKNKLTITWVNLPFMLEYQARDDDDDQNFFLSVGLNIGARIGSYTKQVYFPNDDREKRRTRDDFYLNPFRYDLQMRMGFGKFGIFASYSLNTLFRDNRGPELHPFSVGLRLF